jgi:hypothetical protein
MYTKKEVIDKVILNLRNQADDIGYKLLTNKRAIQAYSKDQAVLKKHKKLIHNIIHDLNKGGNV